VNPDLASGEAVDGLVGFVQLVQGAALNYSPSIRLYCTDVSNSVNGQIIRRHLQAVPAGYTFRSE
jgi:hypothetical protein